MQQKGVAFHLSDAVYVTTHHLLELWYAAALNFEVYIAVTVLSLAKGDLVEIVALKQTLAVCFYYF